MSVESPEAMERAALEGKDREQLLAIAAALGLKAGSRARKADIIDRILEHTGVTRTPSTEEAPGAGTAPPDGGAPVAELPAAPVPAELTAAPTGPALTPAGVRTLVSQSAVAPYPAAGEACPKAGPRR